jgi:hypothetical protein
LFLPLIKSYTMKIYAVEDVLIHAFLITALDGGERSAPGPYRCTSGGKARRHPLGRKLEGFYRGAGCCGEEKNIFTLPEIETDPPVVQNII